MEQIKVRHSELVDFASCPKRYELTWVRGLRPKRTDPKLTLGSMFHAFLEHFEKHLINGEEVAYDEGVKAVAEVQEEHLNKLASEDLAGALIITELSAQVAVMVRGYIAWRREQNLAPIQQTEAKFEQVISIPQVRMEVILTGTIDGIPIDGEGQVWLREYKTCASIKMKKAQYTLDKQTRRYALALQLAGVPVKGIELVLAAKILPAQDEEFLLKKGGVSTDKSKWARATVEQAQRLEKFLDESGKNGLTKDGLHDIIKMLEGRDNPFFYLERIYFNSIELEQIRKETVFEARNIYNTKLWADLVGDSFPWFRNPGIMGMNCKTCPVKTICEMELKGIDPASVIAEHYDINIQPKEGEVEGDEDDMGS